ncbi:hypothetical protein CS022_08875 [Veronia nyctiphanis]|uniref:DUF1315 domain-containing protein n=1 Tax=Veronia nyctiphanis TaxID=1278244 RepID=A0A4Q0YWL3_9GAMM|nr:DUF1315 family protein [Veronia nyctiphanis]RXJ73599.1 hypothetical protein CS022_08875 [Veronia nyctiphanis]
MDTEQLLSSMTPEVLERLNYVVETGKWPDGSVASPEQRDNAMQAIMLYQSRHNTSPQHMTVGAGGDITFKSKQELKRDFSGEGETIAKVKLSDK